MDCLRVLITGCGAPGIKGTIYSLQHNFDGRKIEIVGTDIRDNVIGKYLSDRFYIISRPEEKKKYLRRLYEICEKEKVRIIIPQNTAELALLSSNVNLFKEIGTGIVISEPQVINTANNKYKLMRLCEQINVPTGQFRVVNRFEELVSFSRELGWPKKQVVVKPPVSNGSRGLRIIDEGKEIKRAFYEEKPTGLYIKMEQLKQVLGQSFPELIVTEYLSGDEYTVDCLRTKQTIVVVPRKRDVIRTGITFEGTTVFQPDIIEYSKRITEALRLQYCFGFQFKNDQNGVTKIIECNPRVQGTMVLSTMAGANLIYSAVKLVLKEEIPSFDVKWGTKLIRYWGGISVLGEKYMVGI